MVRRTVKVHMQALIAAFQFLTRVPLPVSVPFDGPVLTHSVIYFPLAGAFIGACLAAAASLFELAVPAWPAAVLLLAIWTGLSGGLHIDGWMDTADGVLSHRSRERMLEIMKDSRVGAMGVLAGVLLLLFKASLLAELLAEGKAGICLSILIISPIWSRTWMAVAIAGWPSARHGEGIGSLFNGVKGLQAAAATLVATGFTIIVLLLFKIEFSEVILWLILCFVLTAACGGLLAVMLNRKLGGLTGDTYGAMNEAVEAVLLLAAVVSLHAL